MTTVISNPPESSTHENIYSPIQDTPNLTLFTFDDEYFYISLVQPEIIEIRDEKRIERHNFQELIRVFTLEPQYRNSNLVVDENAFIDFIQDSKLPNFFHKYHSLQKAFTVHLVTLSSYNENINRDRRSKELSDQQTSKLESNNHKDLLKFMLTILQQGFRFLKPTLLKEVSKSSPGVESSTTANVGSVKQNSESNESSDSTVKDSSVSEDTKEVDGQQHPLATILPPNTVVLRLRGLPWTATASDVEKFFQEVVQIENPEKNILIVLNFHGRATGEAYARFQSYEDAQAAIARDCAIMGHRYIELFPASVEEMEKSRSIMERELLELGNSCVVRMRGLPQGTPNEDIRKFFEGLDDNIKEILLIPRETNKGPGGAYVEFDTAEVVEEALKRNKEKIGTRYIELFRSTKAEMTAAERYLQEIEQLKFENSDKRKWNLKKMKPAKNKSQHKGKKQNVSMTQYVPYGFDNYLYKPNTLVRLRGLPFKADEVDISEFFANLSIVDEGIHFVYNSSDGKKTGEAYVEFKTVQDKEAALAMDKKIMGNRYIEIFPVSKPRRSHLHNQMNTQVPGMMMGSGFMDPQYAEMIKNWYAYFSNVLRMTDGVMVPPQNGESDENNNSEASTEGQTNEKTTKLNANASEFVPDPNYSIYAAQLNALRNMYQSMPVAYPNILEGVTSPLNNTDGEITEEQNDMEATDDNAVEAIEGNSNCNEPNDTVDTVRSE